MSEGGLRVALLARSGDACERIEGALRDAGAEVVLVADPVATTEDAVRQSAPQAIVVALEAGLEDALDAFDALLSDPAHVVIFEEAELAVQRAGWDAARWARHLSAKLHRHQDVLPPGTEDDAQWQPSPGPLPPRAEVENIELAIAAFADEAQLHAEEVPVDSGLELVSGESSASTDTASPFDPVAFEMSDLSLEDVAPPVIDDAMPVRAFDIEAVAEVDFGALALDEQSFDVESGDRSDTQPDANAGQEEKTLTLDAGGLSLVDDSDDAPSAASAAAGEKASERVFTTGGLSLAEASDDVPVVAKPEASNAFEGFESRLSGLSLADPDSYGHGPDRGAVLVEAGLGGPDAVRQLLAAIPEGFPRAVIVRLQLDGGRYDRLVRQMERAAALPVMLATANAEAASGQIYFLPPELGLRRERGVVVFGAESAGELLPAALPANDSALLLLSGASRRVADAASQGDWTTALVAGQSPDGSYDPDAALALVERGGTVGTPAELAALLIERWLPSAAPAPEFEDPEA